MYDYDFDETGFEEPNLLTNFDESMLPIYEKALSLLNDTDLYIDEQAYNCYGHLLSGYYALRTLGYRDRTDFWEIFRSIENNPLT